MELTYPNKQARDAILSGSAPAAIDPPVDLNVRSNWLIQGDNLGVLTALLRAGMRESIDLVYIDPPFATNTIFRHDASRTAHVSAAPSSAVAYEDRLVGPEFLEFLRARLIFLHELMAPHASIFLHIDYKVGHYVKIIMDEVFGRRNFRNDITRIKCNPKNFARKGFGNVKDMILFYTKSDAFTWHEPKVHLTESDVFRLFPKSDDKGRRYTTTPLHAPGETRTGPTGQPWRGMRPPQGRHWRYDPTELERLDSEGLIEWSSTGNPRKKMYAVDAELKGKKLQDVWDAFKDAPYPDYPTEKNIEMLRVIVAACTNPGDTVLDCFSGSGTTLLAAQQLGRQWIGVDASEVAIGAARQRLDDASASLFQVEYGFATAQDAGAPSSGARTPSRA